jgi:Ca-activated chloride channel family protein
MNQETNERHQQHPTVTVDLKASPERQLICPTDSNRYIAFFVHVKQISKPTEQKRQPLSLALVLDRSGSMAGQKLQTAKQAALAVLDQLTPRDSVSLVVFDDQIDTIQSQAAVTPDLKSRVRESLHAIQARASTALHEGWLTGCNSIARSTADAGTHRLARCFLLTDGLANVGVTDPERIASEAAGVRENAEISTSTFGIGSDYNELLLGPMAVAGGGQFHHLRSAKEIINTFVGELGELLSVVARQIRLEIETARDVTLDLISPYWMRSNADIPLRRVISIGDLQSGEDPRIVVRCTFPESAGQEPQVVRARLTWRADQTECSTDWQEIRFSYASQNACDNEVRDSQVIHLVTEHEADRARREAIELNNRGDLDGAARLLRVSASTLRRMLPASSLAAQHEAVSLEDLAQQMSAASAPLPPNESKEIYYQQQRRSRSKADYRQRSQPPAPPEQNH